ncbi:hypothetical protein GF345_03080 [Candidatus Woesearchaeota archaeon]|nr:hypothetical protein [Candidatus Woesearchaeota archaeon]
MHSHKNLKQIIRRILELISEIESYEFYKNNLLETTKRLYDEYQEGMYPYTEYKKLLDSVLKGKSKKEWVKYYNSYIYSLLKQIEPLYSQIIYSMYHDRTSEKLELSAQVKRDGKKEAKEPSPGKPVIDLEDIEEQEKKEQPEPEEDYEFVEVKRPSMISRLRDAVTPDRKDKAAEEDIEDKGASEKGISANEPNDENLLKKEDDVSRIAQGVKGQAEEKPEKIPEYGPEGVSGNLMPKKESLLDRLKESVFQKSIDSRKRSIESKIRKAGRGSLARRLSEKILTRKSVPKKPEPITAPRSREGIIAGLKSRLNQLLGSVSSKPRKHSKSKEEKHKRDKKDRRDQKDRSYETDKPYSRKEELPSILHSESRIKKVIDDLKLKARLALMKVIPSKKPAKAAQPPKKRKFFDALKGAVKQKKDEEPKIILKPDEDKALKRLIDNVDRINEDISSGRTPEASMPLGIRFKIAMIRLHLTLRNVLRKRPEISKKLPEAAVPEMEEPEVPEKQEAEKPEITEEPEEKVPEPLKKPAISGIIKKPGDILKSIASAAKSAVTKPMSVLNNLYKRSRKPEVEPEKVIKAAPELKKEPEKILEKPKTKIGSSIWSPIKAWYRRLSEEEKKFISKKTHVPHSLHVEALKDKIVPAFEQEKIPSGMLSEEVDRIKGIMEQKKKFEVYQPSYYGSIANTLVRRLTFYLVDRFPGIFKRLYDQLRLANIKVLSNTYLNIMMLSVILAFGGSFILFSVFFLLARNPLFIIFPKSLIMALIFAIVVFILFYMYPSIQAKNRERSINTNLPFAINHISAVSGSGVPPTKMFKLLVESEEYGEVASELGKIVEYVDLFGYDLLTAIRSVSLTVPSAPLKEFLEGIVSTIESGSEIKDYLKQKASEAMLSYELERQKYLETIATYSDVYTGILIAAPLFFIVALSLVSMLGGTIGGMDINLIIVIGAYVVIPLLNILFLVFIELTQPEV